MAARCGKAPRCENPHAVPWICDDPDYQEVLDLLPEQDRKAEVGPVGGGGNSPKCSEVVLMRSDYAELLHDKCDLKQEVKNLQVEVLCLKSKIRVLKTILEQRTAERDEALEALASAVSAEEGPGE